MSLEELWHLFPIFLVEHKDEWDVWYCDERQNLETLLLGKKVKRISHIGSTSIPGIWAKDIVDILVEVADTATLDAARKELMDNGWLLMSNDGDRASLNKGYTEEGFADRVFHLHLRLTGDNDELYFRDYLRDHPEDAEKYQRLKLSLWKKFEYNRDAYTDAKGDFIKRCTDLAHLAYGDRYATRTRETD